MITINITTDDGVLLGQVHLGAGEWDLNGPQHLEALGVEIRDQLPAEVVTALAPPDD